jgi:hypothetical protein
MSFETLWSPGGLPEFLFCGRKKRMMMGIDGGVGMSEMVSGGRDICVRVVIRGNQEGQVHV